MTTPCELRILCQIPVMKFARTYAAKQVGHPTRSVSTHLRSDSNTASVDGVSMFRAVFVVATAIAGAATVQIALTPLAPIYTAAGMAHADPYDDATYGRLAADAHNRGIPGGTTQIGTLAEAVCTLTSDSMTRGDVDATQRDTAPLAWSVLQSWTQAQKQTFAALVIADGYCGSIVTTQTPLAP
jgi:hypothetical protein